MTPVTPHPSDPPDEQTRSLLGVVVVLRVALLVWATVVVVIDARGPVELHVPLAFGLLGVLVAWTAFDGWLLRHDATRLTRRWVTVLDVALGAATLGADRLVYEGPHPQTLGSAWPLSAAVVAGILHGPRIGAASGLVISGTGAVGLAVFRTDGLQGRWLATLGTIVLMTVSGALAGVLTDRLRRAEMVAARAQAREEVARRLHDGVLQTLAVVQRRSTDAGLVTMAREQELGLRGFIESSEPVPAAEVLLVDELRRITVEAERRHGMRGELVVIETPGALDAATVAALTGAVGEALTNASKHGGASRAVVCVDLDAESLTCSIVDDGCGFDPGTTPEGTGLRRSVRGRIAELGGEVEIRSRTGDGCEVLLRVPGGAQRARRYDRRG
ncbi:MAG: sensor histidine kinase [Microthrixaceae bacterium]